MPAEAGAARARSGNRGNAATLAAAPRCGARTRAGTACRAPAMAGRARCRMHGGTAQHGAPLENRNAVKHGRCCRERRAERRKIAAIIRAGRRAIAAMA